MAAPNKAVAPNAARSATSRSLLEPPSLNRDRTPGLGASPARDSPSFPLRAALLRTIVVGSTMSLTEAELVQIGTTYLYPNYRQPPLVMSHGRGVELWDKSGRRYLDFIAGIAVNSTGHAHPSVVSAIAEQAARLMQISNYFFNEPNILLARRLCQQSGMARALFCNSGTEAIEAGLKLARRYFYNQQQPDRHRVIAFERSFHGRTMGSLAATGQAAYRDGFGPLSSVTHVPYGDAAAVRAAMGPDVAAILVEPVQGEGGVTLPPHGFLAELRAIADAHGCLLMADEIQTGIGRTGTFLAFEHWGVQADIVALAKGLGGGFPIGAMLCRAHLQDTLPPGSHGSTFGGNPLASATALAVLDVLESEQLMEAAQTQGDYLGVRLSAIAEKYPRLAREARGIGLLRALELAEGVDARSLLTTLRERGLLVSIAGGCALRFSPALVVKPTQIDEALAVLDEVLNELGNTTPKR